jgi:hypothetical protein
MVESHPSKCDLETLVRDRSSDGSGSKQTAARFKLSRGVRSPRGRCDLCGSVGRKLQAIPRLPTGQDNPADTQKNCQLP